MKLLSQDVMPVADLFRGDAPCLRPVRELCALMIAEAGRPLPREVLARALRLDLAGLREVTDHEAFAPSRGVVGLSHAAKVQLGLCPPPAVRPHDPFRRERRALAHARNVATVAEALARATPPPRAVRVGPAGAP